MLFKPDMKAASDGVTKVAGGARRRIVSIAVTVLILGGLGFIGWRAMQPRQDGGGDMRRGGFRPDMMTTTADVNGAV